MNKYRLRPAYGTSELLLEFVNGPEKKSFLAELKDTLSELDIETQSIQDLWMNDEGIFMIDSKRGPFTLSIDTWGLAFIMAQDNQDLILKIDAILSVHPNFLKEMVDFEDYKRES